MINYLSLLIPGVILIPNILFFMTQLENGSITKNINTEGLVTKNTNEKQADIGNNKIQILTILEGAGRISVFVLPVFYSISINNRLDRAALFGMVLMLLVYYLGWIRYFISRRDDGNQLFSPLLGIPVPLAVSPVFYFFFSAIVLDAKLLFVASGILAVSHIPLSMREYRMISEDNNITVSFLEKNSIAKELIKYAVITAFYQDKLIVVRHQERDTLEIPGGHIEKGESDEEAARRELYEESGALEFELHSIGVYEVDRGKSSSYGHLFYAEVKKLGPLPESEIAEVKLVDELPDNLTYPDIQPRLYKKVLEYMEDK